MVHSSVALSYADPVEAALYNCGDDSCLRAGAKTSFRRHVLKIGMSFSHPAPVSPDHFMEGVEDLPVQERNR
jgi:hypothetical protein